MLNIIQILRIFKRHWLLLISVPVILALLVVYLTRNPVLIYSSKTIIYTGIASGYRLDQEAKIDFFAINNSFDNLINLVKSRQTLAETSVRLLTQNLMLDEPVQTYINGKNYRELHKMVPQYVKDLVVKPKLKDSIYYEAAYRRSVANLMNLMNSSDTNFVYELTNFVHKHYSIRALSSVSVKRIQNSDLIEVSYESDDPGITMQTLRILSEVLMENYRGLRENSSDVIVRYFQEQVNLAMLRLKAAEDRLLAFNEQNKIINYYEQSKFIAEKKEDLEVNIAEEKMKYAGAVESLKKVEEKLQVQGQIQNITDGLINKRNSLAEITEKITINELYNEQDTATKRKLAGLKHQAQKIREQINDDIGLLYRFQNSIEGLPIDEILTKYLDNLVAFSESKAGLDVLYDRQNNFMKNYEVFAPLGATLKRIEREIDVSEQEYLSLLHSLNLAKLKQQNLQLATNIKPVDKPYFPLAAKPSSRKMLVIVAALFGFIFVAFSLLVAEYLDRTIKTPARASKLTGLEFVGMMPRLTDKLSAYNMGFINNRLIELATHGIKMKLPKENPGVNNEYKILIFSTMSKEGKTFIAHRIVEKLRSAGERVLFLNFYKNGFYEDDDTGEEINQPEYDQEEDPPGEVVKKGFLSKLTRLLKPSDTDEIQPKIPRNENNVIYNIRDDFSSLESLDELAGSPALQAEKNHRYIFLEIPSIIYNSYPINVIRTFNHAVLVCRANREWKEADEAALEHFKEIFGNNITVFLNGSEIQYTESILGELPKKRSRLTRLLKRILRMQFYSKYSLNKIL